MSTERHDLTGLESTLEEAGIPMQLGATDPETGRLYIFGKLNNGKTAICSVWYGSQNPTEHEVNLMAGYTRSRMSSYPSETEGFYAKDANTIIFKKEDDLWTYRRLIWTQNKPWSARPLPLDELLNSL